MTKVSGASFVGVATSGLLSLVSTLLDSLPKSIGPEQLIEEHMMIVPNINQKNWRIENHPICCSVMV